ncbi:zinc-ribbon domain-containing protein [Opitutales bacterium]|nr:zinc-ribbon domain-containing protein [Opitutales bacterium]
MFCSSCGKQIADDAVVCVGCGRSTRKASGSGEAWGVGLMIIMVIGTLIIPFIGLVAGVIDLTKEPKRAQGAGLLALGAIMTVAYMTTM